MKNELYVINIIVNNNKKFFQLQIIIRIIKAKVYNYKFVYLLF